MIPEPSDALLARYAVPAPRYTSYPTVPSWSGAFGADDFSATLNRAADKPESPLSLYVHLPFCRSLCWYCGCNVVISKAKEAADRYLDHLALELTMLAERLGARRTLSQVHWGGGTPTFLDDAQIQRLWSEITRHFSVLPSAEIAIEVHPSVTNEGQLTTLRACGFNRLSMGLQDFDPTVQRLTNRIQTPEVTSALLQTARSLGFGGINFDLIYGLPGQNMERWERTLCQVLSMRPDRLAVYRFAYLPSQLKHQRRMPEQLLPRGREPFDLFFAAMSRFHTAGYEAIGLDHFALPTDELARAAKDGTLSRNFQGYTVQSATDVVAVGSTAISDVGGAWAQSVRPLPRYYEAVAAGRFATERGMWTSPDDRRRGEIITRLMCHFEVDAGDGFETELSRLAPMQADGLVEVEGTRVRMTPMGRFFVRNAAMAFDAYLCAESTTKFSKAV